MFFLYILIVLSECFPEFGMINAPTENQIDLQYIRDVIKITK